MVFREFCSYVSSSIGSLRKNIYLRTFSDNIIFKYWIQRKLFDEFKLHFLNSKVVLLCRWIAYTNTFSVDISNENEKLCNIKRRSKHLVCMECPSHYIISTLEIKAIWHRKQKWLLRPLLYVWDNLILYSFRISCYITIQNTKTTVTS